MNSLLDPGMLAVDTLFFLIFVGPTMQGVIVIVGYDK